MKNLFTLVFAFLFSVPLFSQIEWAAEGTRWWYNTRDFGAYNMTFEYLATGQATVGGELCQVIEKGNDVFYTYESDGEVFLWNDEDSVFTLLHDWNKVQGETYDCSTAGVIGQELTCHVDTVYSIEFEGQNFQAQKITIYNPDVPCCNSHETVVEGIGGMTHFDSRFVTALTIDIVFDLLCFESAPTGLLTITEVPFANCFSLANATFEVNGQLFEMTVSPNPALGDATLRYTLPPGVPAAGIHIFDSLGRQLSFFEIKNAQGEIPLGNLPAGLHFVTLVVDGKVVGTERVVAR